MVQINACSLGPEPVSRLKNESQRAGTVGLYETGHWPFDWLKMVWWHLGIHHWPYVPRRYDICRGWSTFLFVITTLSRTLGRTCSTGSPAPRVQDRFNDLLDSIPYFTSCTRLYSLNVFTHSSVLLRTLGSTLDLIVWFVLRVRF
jgi:hypothetical protein